MIGDSIGGPQIRAIIVMNLSLEHLTKLQRKHSSIASSQTSKVKPHLNRGRRIIEKLKEIEKYNNNITVQINIILYNITYPGILLKRKEVRFILISKKGIMIF